MQIRVDSLLVGYLSWTESGKRARRNELVYGLDSTAAADGDVL